MSQNNIKRIAMMQRMICHYQMPYIVMLHHSLKEEGAELKVFAGIVEDKEYSLEEDFFSRLLYLSFKVKIGGIDDKLVLLPSILFSLIRFKPDIIVTEDISAMPNCLMVFLYSKIFNVPYIIWGPGSIPNKKPSLLRYFMEPLISLYRHGAKAFLCYSSYAKNYYLPKYNRSCFVAHNSTMRLHSDKEYNEIINNVRNKYLDPLLLNILFIGRLIPQKKVDVLLQTISKLSSSIPNIHLYIIGGGPSENNLIKFSQELGITDKISFLGQITNQTEKKRFFWEAHLGILPGLGGLAIQEMMWYGIPVIASWADGTEQELIIEGKGGIFLSKSDEDNLIKSIRDFITLSTNDKIEMAMNALNIVKNKYNINSMVKAFREAIYYNRTN